jgi:sugar phosphate isomerase/epimerase
MRIGYCSWGMMEIDIEKVIPAVAKIGYHGLELAVTSRWPTALETLTNSKRHRISELLDQYNLVLTGVAGHTSMCDDDEDKNAVNMQRLRDSIDLTAELKQEGELSIMVSLIGGKEDEWDTKKDIIAERVRALGDYAADRGVILAVEPHCGTAFDLPERAVWLMETLNHPSVRLNFDISHFDIRGISIDDCVPQLVPWSVTTHVKDQRGTYPNHEFMTPGSGPFDFVHYLSAMYNAGYTGFIGIEVSVMVQRQPHYDPFVDAALGYYALRHAFNVSSVPLD